MGGVTRRRPERAGPLGAALAALVLAGLAAAPGAAPAAAQSPNPDVVEWFHSDIDVGADGSIVVTETWITRFNADRNGVVRTLGMENRDAEGNLYRVDLNVVSATDADGEPLRFEAEDARGGEPIKRVRIWVPGATAGSSHTVVLRYRVSDAIRFFDAESGPGHQDELYWQITGFQWEIPIESATARVFFPPGTAPIEAAAYVGGPDSGRQVPIRLAGTSAEVDDVGRLPPGEGFTVAVAVQPGVIARPNAADRMARWLALLWPFAIPLAVLGWALAQWNAKGRDPAEQAVVVHWEPPASLTSAQMGTLVDNTADVDDLVSMLVDLAAKGYIEIEELEKSGLLNRGTDYALHLVKPKPEWDLPRHQEEFLDALFVEDFTEIALSRRGFDHPFRDKSKDRVSLLGALADTVNDLTGSEPTESERFLATIKISDLKNSFYKRIDPIQDRIYQSLVEEGFYARRPDRVRRPWFVASSVPALAVYLTAPGRDSGAAAWALTLALGATALILMGFGSLMTARTTRGARVREKALGFKKFLERVELPRYRRMIKSPDQFEAYLAYAMAFGVEEQWARAFDDMLQEPPHWYHGRNRMFRPSAFASDLAGFSASVSSAMSSSPGSVSGSGGGGSVGGGGGGGGGGTF